MSEKLESETPSDAAACSAAKPRRRVEVEIKIGADSIADLVRALEQISFDVDRGSRSVVSGGPNAGWHYRVDEDQTITHASYFEAVDIYLGRKKSQ